MTVDQVHLKAALWQKYYGLTQTGLRMLSADDAARIIIEILQQRSDFSADNYAAIAFHANVQERELGGDDHQPRSGERTL